MPYLIEPEQGGRRYGVYEVIGARKDFIARYMKLENAEKHVRRLEEKWGHMIRD